MIMFCLKRLLNVFMIIFGLRAYSIRLRLFFVWRTYPIRLWLFQPYKRPFVIIFGLKGILYPFVIVAAIETSVRDYFWPEGPTQSVRDYFLSWRRYSISLSLFQLLSTYFLTQFISDRFSLKELLNLFLINFYLELYSIIKKFSAVKNVKKK